MQFKSITAIAVLLLVVVSLLVSGCTSKTTNQTPSASATPSEAASLYTTNPFTATPLAANPVAANPKGVANPGAANPGAANVGAAAPSWIRPGLSVTYDGISGPREQYMTSRAVMATITSRVTGGDGATYNGDITVQNKLYPNIVQTYQWSYTNGDPTLGGNIIVIWVDPANPTHAYGYPWVIVGQGPFKTGGYTWDATTLIYRVPDTVGEHHMVYDTQSGLVLYYDELNPYFTEQRWFSSISWD